MSNNFLVNRMIASRVSLAAALVSSLLMTGCSDSDNNNFDKDGSGADDRAYYVLPPGNYGGIPTNDNSLDQLPLYDGLTPLRGHVTDADIEGLFIPEDFQPVGETVEEATGRAGTTILYDEFGVAHITGVTREDMAFGAGWVAIRDRGFLLSQARGASRVAVADVPGINAFGLVVEFKTFVPSAATEQLVSDQVALIIETYGDEGQQIIDEAQAYADGINAWLEANGGNPVPWTPNDVVSITAFIGSIFGAGGGSEASNAEYLSTLIDGLGAEPGRLAWEDTMLCGYPEAPTTIETHFDYGHLTGGEGAEVIGAAVIDAGSVESLDPLEPLVMSVKASPKARAKAIAEKKLVSYPAAGAPPKRLASNFLRWDSPQSQSGNNLAVMGPQLGYYYP